MTTTETPAVPATPKLSFWGKIVKFFDAAADEVESLFGKAATVEQKIQSAVTYMAPFVNSLIVLIAKNAAPEAAKVLTTVQSDLATISTVCQNMSLAAGGTGAQIILTAAASIKASLPGILTAVGVKDAANFSEIESVATLVLGEIEAVIENVTGLAVPAI